MISRVVPKLPFIDKQETIQFYVDRLGFTLRSDYGDYVIIDLQEAELHFFSFPALVPGKSDFMIYLRVSEDIKTIYERFQKKGVAIHPNGKLEDKGWGQREFAIIDPNGTLLTFGQSI
jgi:uncharacterized glyoxalase superfamily protein PhnB